MQLDISSTSPYSVTRSVTSRNKTLTAGCVSNQEPWQQPVLFGGFHGSLLLITQQAVTCSWHWRFNFVAQDVYLKPSLPCYFLSPCGFLSHMYRKLLGQSVPIQFFKGPLVLVVPLRFPSFTFLSHPPFIKPSNSSFPFSFQTLQTIYFP